MRAHKSTAAASRGLLGSECLSDDSAVFKRGLNVFKRGLTAKGDATMQQAHLSREKLALIHIAKQQLGMDDADYRALLRGVAGVSSSTALNMTGFQAVMARFAQLGFVSRKGAASQALTPHARATNSYRLGMATPAQIDAIRQMWASWQGQASERALSRWLEHHFGVSAMRFCDVRTAQKAIEALKAMLARKARFHTPQHGNAGASTTQPEKNL